MTSLSPSFLASIAQLRTPAPRPSDPIAAEAYDAGMRAAFEEYARPQQLPDGTVGYPVRAPRTDDCFAAAIATTLQVPIESVPDPQIDERLNAGQTADAVSRRLWSELAEWLSERGLRMLVHQKVPVPLARWIGVVQLPGAFHDHCLVMQYREVLFDPTWTPSGMQFGRRVRSFKAEDVKYGLSFGEPTATTTLTKPKE